MFYPPTILTLKQQMERIIVLVNSKSGGRKGWKLGKEFKKIGLKVYDMLELSKSDELVNFLSEGHYSLFLCIKDVVIILAISIYRFSKIRK